MTYTDDQVLRGARRLRTLGAMALALTVTGCGELGSVQFAPGQFRVHGFGMYAHDADLQKEAARVCPQGFTKTDELETAGTADVKGAVFLDITCSEPSK